MSDKEAKAILLDTSYLRETGFKHPDLRKLLRYAKENVVKIFVPFIVWEECRTQLSEKAIVKAGVLRQQFEELGGYISNTFALGGLSQPSLQLWSDDEINSYSRQAMAAFADENKVQIIPIAPDHADRAWRRYFDTGIPFNAAEERKNRRKDIPDAWILETAIDLKAKHSELVALCSDRRLSDALESIGVRVFKDTQVILNDIEQAQMETKGLQQQPPGEVLSTPTTDQNRLKTVLTEAQQEFQNLDCKVLGYVAYLGSPTKNELFTLLSQAGVRIEVAQNIAQRLALAGIIKDTGNHYLSDKNEASEIAAALVEPEIIKALQG
jgi:rRNA-processing protein FCF1